MGSNNQHNIPAVEAHGVQELVLDMYRDGKSVNSIRQALLDSGVKISGPSITKWIKKQAELFKESKNTDLKTLEKFELMTMDYENEIKTILNEVKEMKAIAIQEGKLDTYAKLVDRIYRGLELLAKLMGDIKPNGSIDINLIINEINKATFVDNKEIRKSLFRNDDNVLDVEAEILEEDKKAEEKING